MRAAAALTVVDGVVESDLERHFCALLQWVGKALT